MTQQSAHAVFLSYASQDAPAARRICDALRSSGIEVWFDQSELRGGDAWDQKIRHQIRDCALFVPIISTHTASRPEGYFRLEWAIADQRTQMIARNKAFIVPVCIDGTPEGIADLPDSFHRVQWTRLPAGETPPAFCQRIAALLGVAEEGAVPPSPRMSPPGAALAKAPPPWRWILVGAVAVILAGVLVLKPWRSPPAPPAAPAAPTAPAVTPDAAAANAAPERSIAVLPFTDMSEKKDQEYFSDGLSEELIDMLTKVPDLRVPARTSSFYFKGQHATIAEIAKALSVTHVLEGSVRKSGNTLRVTAQLIRADNGYHLWSETYDRSAQDVFKVQDEIAARVVDALKVSLPAATTRRTGNAEAYNQFLLGKNFMDRTTPAGYASAERAFRRAIALDPDYAAAYSQLALAEAYWSDQTGDASGLTRAAADAERAIALAPDRADGYFARGYLRTLWLWNHEGAGADLRKALALDPNNADILEGYALHLESEGDLPGARAAIDQALGVDPLRASMQTTRGLLLVALRDLPGARAAFQRVLEIHPDSARAYAELALVELLAGHADQALVLAQKPAADLQGGWPDIAMALVQHSLGHDDESRQALDRVIAGASKFAAFQIAEIYAWRGEKDQAFAWLDRAYAQRDGGLTRLRSDPLLDSLRTDARYRAFLEKMRRPQ